MSVKNYSIYFGIEKKAEGDNENQEIKAKNEILENNVKNEGYFNFYDYYSNSTIGYLKEFFLTNFGKQFNFCQCLLSLYYKSNSTFGQNKYHLLSDSDNKKLKEFNYDELYLIKVDALCDCEYKEYMKYMNMKKFDLITRLKKLEMQNKENENKIKEYEEIKPKYLNLKEEIKKLKKSDEIQNYKGSKFEDFYDIVIDINSIKNVNKEGWKVKFNEKGLEKYQQHGNNTEDKVGKGQKSITIEVVGNNNKGKSFLLSKISKIQLLTGTSIQTKGLSVKYPELENYKGRQLILLDSAGLETPVLKKINTANKFYKRIILI